MPSKSSEPNLGAVEAGLAHDRKPLDARVSRDDQPTPRHGGFVRPSAETSAKMRAFLARWGDQVAARMFALDRHTCARCAAGLTMQAFALHVIEEGLKVPDDEVQAYERGVNAGRKRQP
jgi:hypothetical protein